MEAYSSLSSMKTWDLVDISISAARLIAENGIIHLCLSYLVSSGISVWRVAL